MSAVSHPPVRLIINDDPSLSTSSSVSPAHQLGRELVAVPSSPMSEIKNVIFKDNSSLIAKVASWALGVLALALSAGAFIHFIAIDFTVGLVLASVALIVAIVAKNLYPTSDIPVLTPIQLKSLLESERKDLILSYGSYQTELNLSAASGFIPHLELRDLHNLLLSEYDEDRKISFEMKLKLQNNLGEFFRRVLEKPISPSNFNQRYVYALEQITKIEKLLSDKASIPEVQIEGQVEGERREGELGQIKESEAQNKFHEWEAKDEKDEQSLWGRINTDLTRFNEGFENVKNLKMSSVAKLISSSPNVIKVNLGACVCLETFKALQKTKIETLVINEQVHLMPVVKKMVKILVNIPTLQIVEINTKCIKGEAETLFKQKFYLVENNIWARR